MIITIIIMIISVYYRNEISDYERKAFVVFITSLNSKNVVLSETNENNKYFINVLRNALKSNELTYEPLKRNDEMQKKENRSNVYRTPSA